MTKPLDFELDPDSLLTVLPFPALLLDSNLVIRKTNLTWLDYLGYRVDQVQGQELKDFLPEQERDSLLKKFQGLPNIPGSARFQCRFNHQNGSILEFICGGNSLFGEQEIALRTLWVLVPVNQAGEPLDDESLSWLVQSRGMMSHLPAAVSIKDSDEKILFVNELFAAQIGKTPQEIIGLHSNQITPPELREQYHRENQRVLEGKEIREESVFPGPEGQTYWLTDKFPIQNPDGSVLVGSISFEITERVQVEQALENLQADLLESEERFRMLAENSLDIIALIGPDLKLQYLSPASERITGYSQDDFQDRDIFEIIHPDDLPGLQQSIQSAIEDSIKMDQFTFRILTKQGQIRWIEASTAYIYNKQGELNSILVYRRDVTERLEIQQALKESERQKDLILNATSEMVAYYEPDLRVIWANRSAAESVGKEPGQLVGMYCYEIWNKSDQPCPDCPVLRARETGSPQQTEQITPDGRYWMIRGFPVKDEAGKVIGMVEFGQDVTSQKRAEKALQISRERFRDLYRKTPVMLHSINKAGELVEVTDYWLEVMGYEREEVIGRSSTDFLTEKSRKYAEETALPEFFQKGQARDVHYKFVTKSGEILDILMSAVGEWDSEGNFIRSLAVMDDVTERFAAQRQLQESEEKYRRLVDGSPNIHYIYSTQSGAKFWSRRIEDILSFDPDDFIREPFRWTSAIHSEDRNIITQRMEEISPGDSFDLEYRIADSSGNWHWLRDRSINISRVDGEILIEGVAEDITRRKRLEIIQDFHLELVNFSSDEPVEHLLQFALDQAEKVTDSLRGLAVIMDPEGKIPTVQIWSTGTQAASRDLPLDDPRQAQKHAGVWEEAVKTNQPVIYNDLDEIMEDQGIPSEHLPVQRELIVPVTRNNQVVAVFSVRNKPHDYDLDDLEMVSRIADLFWEFAAEQRAREDLRKSEERYRGIVEDQSEMICRFDRQGTLTFINQAYADFLGKDVDDLLGTDLFAVIPTEDVARVKEKLFLLTLEKPQNQNRNLNLSASGELRWVEWTNRAIYDPDGKLLEYQSVGYDIHDQLMLEEALKDSEQDYRQLVHYLQETREDERSQVAREIHDEFGQVLTAMKFDLDWLLKRDKFEDGPEEKRLRAMIEMVDKTQAQVRRIGTRLRPDMLDNLGLQAALEWQLEDFSKRVHIQSTFEFTGEEDLIPDDVEIDIYRLVQEALTNIARHAEADQVLVEIQVSQENINCMIRDDGVGFEKEEFDSHKSFGIISMQERVYRWNGDFEIRGEPGRGTKILVLIPLQGEQHD